MDEIAKRFAELGEKYGPHVVDAARGAVRVEAYSVLAGSLLMLCCAAALIFVAWWLHKQKDWDNARYVGVILTGLIGALCLGGGIWSWIDPWTWAAINYPDLYMAKKVLKL